MDFKLNFLGINVADFAQSYRFYTEVLGVEARDAKPDWAYFATTGMIFELFGGGEPPPRDRARGHGQTIRPSIQIAHLEQTVSNLRHKGVKFIGAIERTFHPSSVRPPPSAWCGSPHDHLPPSALIPFQRCPPSEIKDRAFLSCSILWFTLTFRDSSRKPGFAILHDRISKPGQESAPRKVRVNLYCAV
jgi:predicted enzyme related to lactoylglutathione lyase